MNSGSPARNFSGGIRLGKSHLLLHDAASKRLAVRREDPRVGDVRAGGEPGESGARLLAVPGVGRRGGRHRRSSPRSRRHVAASARSLIWLDTLNSATPSTSVVNAVSTPMTRLILAARLSRIDTPSIGHRLTGHGPWAGAIEQRQSPRSRGRSAAPSYRKPVGATFGKPRPDGHSWDIADTPKTSWQEFRSFHPERGSAPDDPRYFDLHALDDALFRLLSTFKRIMQKWNRRPRHG